MDGGPAFPLHKPYIKASIYEGVIESRGSFLMLCDICANEYHEKSTRKGLCKKCDEIRIAEKDSRETKPKEKKK